MRKLVEVDKDGIVICEISTKSNTDFKDKKYIDITDIEDSKKPKCGFKHDGEKKFSKPAKDIKKKKEDFYSWFESMADKEIFVTVDSQIKNKVKQTVDSMDDYDEIDSMNGFFFGLLIEYIDENGSVPDKDMISLLKIKSDRILKTLQERSGE